MSRLCTNLYCDIVCTMNILWWRRSDTILGISSSCNDQSWLFKTEQNSTTYEHIYFLYTLMWQFFVKSAKWNTNIALLLSIICKEIYIPPLDQTRGTVGSTSSYNQMDKLYVKSHKTRGFKILLPFCSMDLSQ